MEPCARPGCSGQIEDGYCTECGLAPAGAPSAASAPSSTRSTRSTRSSPSSRSSSTQRRASGVALSAVPAVPAVDPLAALIEGKVPDRKRICSNCDAKLSREKGFCPKCGQEYSFKPSLQPGAIVAGKYDVKGTIAFGGLGWIYLALDTVLNRWVVLKGLLNAKDQHLARVAVQEREYLAAVKHRNIVGIYDFLTHGSEGFIVMEYVNGKSLLTLRREHGGPLPPLDACSYILELMPAFSYLHQMGLVYCDFKIENAIVEGDTVKLIDMGAVRRVDDTGGDIYGTRGYAAPEANDTPTPVSDLYTVGRALAVLVADFDFQGTFENELPQPGQAPVFRDYPSLYRLLLKATRADPATRFQSADEMATQLHGVLRDVAAGTGALGPIDSLLFEGDSGSLPLSAEESLTSRGALPGLRPTPGDPAAAAVATAALVPDPAARLALLERALQNWPDSLDLPFRLAGAAIDSGAPPAEITRWLDLAEAADPGDWRTMWFKGQAALAAGNGSAAVSAFDAVLGEVPGELAPKLALGYAFELANDLDSAAEYFNLVAQADPTFTSAAFGLARCLRAKGDRDGAAAALDRVPPSSSRYETAQLAMGEILLGDAATPPGPAELERAAAALGRLRPRVDSVASHHLAAKLFLLCANAVEIGATPPANDGVLGVPRRVASLRAAAERELRSCAHLATSRDDRIRFVDDANRARPLTLI